MKRGSFILVTTAPPLLNSGYPGVLSPTEFAASYRSSFKAVVLDKNLNADLRNDLREGCLKEGFPCFIWSVPDALAEADAAVWEKCLLDFLKEQNQWKSRPPSPETVVKIEMQTLVDILTTANSLLEPEEVMLAVMTRIHQLITCEAWSVLMLRDKEEALLRFAAAFGPGKEHLENAAIPIGKGIAGWVFKHRQPVIVNNAQSDPRFLSTIDEDTKFLTKNILCAPLISRGRTIGVIEMLNRDLPEGFSEGDLELLLTLVNPAAVAIENAYLFQQAQLLTIQDDLTKLYNSRHLNQCLENEVRRAARTAEPLSLIFLDLDGFKAVNDNYGHLQGSRSLVEISQLIKGASRETDIVGRYGGDEFVLILPNTAMEGARVIGERIRLAIESYCLKDLCLTASIGIACYPRHGAGKEELIRLADKAMYKVKERGKNGILTACQI